MRAVGPQIRSEGNDPRRVDVVVGDEVVALDVRIELTQNGTITGNEAFFTVSAAGVTGSSSSGTLELALASVPEPGVLALTLLQAANVRRGELAL